MASKRENGRGFPEEVHDRHPSLASNYTREERKLEIELLNGPHKQPRGLQTGYALPQWMDLPRAYDDLRCRGIAHDQEEAALEVRADFLDLIHVH